MKKFISILIAFSIILTSVIVYAGELENLKAIDAAPQNFVQDTLFEPVSRAEFAYMTAKILDSSSRAKVNTRFADVTEEHEYSGYIEYLAGCGVLSGTDGAMFSPDEPADLNMANKILVCALGYSSFAENLGGYPDGYNIIAQDLSLNEDVQMSGSYLTKGSAVILIENVLLTELPTVQMGIVNGENVLYQDNKSPKRLLCDVLSINAYQGVVTKVDYNQNLAVFLVEGNKYDQNKEPLTAGESYRFDSINTINISEYEQVPVTVWVNSDETIVNIIPSKKAEVKYGYIEKINGSSDTEKDYPAQSIEEIILVGDEDEYDASETLTIKYNDSVTAAPVELCGRFAKLVLLDGEVSFIESWNVTEGGMITEIGEADITYIRGGMTGLKLKEVIAKETIRVFIDNKAADLKDLRENSVFDMYETDSSIVIVASEKVFKDELLTYSSGNYVEVGNLICYTDGVLYCAAGSDTYVENSGVDKLFGQTVCVYIAPNGYAKYITNSESALKLNTFYAVISGVQSDIFMETAEVELYKVDGTSVEKGIYEVTEKTKYIGEGLNLETVGKNAKDLDGACLYEIETNGAGKILSVSEPAPFYGLTKDSVATVGQFSDTPNGYLTIDKMQIYFPSTAPITCIYESDGEFKVSQTTWNSLRSHYASGSKIKLYGGEKTDKPEFILMCGDLTGITDYHHKFGIYTGMLDTVNENGEVCKSLRVITASGEQEYIVTDETAKNIDEATGGAGLIHFYTGVSYSDDEIKLNTAIAKLGEEESEWVCASDAKADGLHKGTIDRVAGDRVFFTDGSAYFLYYTTSYRFFASVDDNAPKNRFKLAELSDFTPGEEVYYYLRSGAIYGMILVK